ncbi:hypothetical protein BWD08_03155 [Neisseria animaloris]|nr:hypothetical protein BWD08_03155 [Neisseria animaloris]
MGAITDRPSEKSISDGLAFDFNNIAPKMRNCINTVVKIGFICYIIPYPARLRAYSDQERINL